MHKYKRAKLKSAKTNKQNTPIFPKVNYNKQKITASDTNIDKEDDLVYARIIRVNTV